MDSKYSTHSTLIHRLQAGDDALAWEDFVRRYGTLIRAVAYRHGLQPADADDILQDVLIGLTNAMPRFVYDPQRARFRTFLQTIVQRTVFRRFRQKQTASGITGIERVPSDDLADTIWEAEWRQYHLRQAMETIEVEFGASDREAFTMYVGSQNSASETAAALGMSVDQVYQAKSRILKRMGELIEAQIKDEG